MGKWFKAMAVGLVIAISAQFMMGFASDCGEIREQVLRLHILANSDSEEDQQLKLAVRDRILEESGELFETLGSKTEAEDSVKEHLAQIEEIARQEIEGQGYSYPVKAECVNMFFDTRVYEDFTLPAGQYDAVRITIGEAKGHNWWCVLYPMMCLPAAQPKEALEETFTASQTEIIENSDDYQIEFATVELIEKLKDWLSF
ncbi:stage II sporulation protein R [uncultured Ruminococcus sp.]|uniref:stage II sporulation protein R n=1 Tax=Massiliimalia timonensis TaxID=1987501 RepID=UPI0008227290|nr:stage II sporulation protein R [Massiliimalia timonensis]SCH01426.1 stage II sporulation protein R [uncultured Clostridium sp.]SCH97324.1 stage II sporulation protein R [uncultured Ruminococcus sp.]